MDKNELNIFATIINGLNDKLFTIPFGINFDLRPRVRHSTKDDDSESDMFYTRPLITINCGNIIGRVGIKHDKHARYLELVLEKTGDIKDSMLKQAINDIKVFFIKNQTYSGLLLPNDSKYLFKYEVSQNHFEISDLLHCSFIGGIRLTGFRIDKSDIEYLSEVFPNIEDLCTCKCEIKKGVDLSSLKNLYDYADRDSIIESPAIVDGALHLNADFGDTKFISDCTKIINGSIGRLVFQNTNINIKRFLMTSNMKVIKCLEYIMKNITKHEEKSIIDFVKLFHFINNFSIGVASEYKTMIELKKAIDIFNEIMESTNTPTKLGNGFLYSAKSSFVPPLIDFNKYYFMATSNSSKGIYINKESIGNRMAMPYAIADDNISEEDRKLLDTFYKSLNEDNQGYLLERLFESIGNVISREVVDKYQQEYIENMKNIEDIEKQSYDICINGNPFKSSKAEEKIIRANKNKIQLLINSNINLLKRLVQETTNVDEAEIKNTDKLSYLDRLDLLIIKHNLNSMQTEILKYYLYFLDARNNKDCNFTNYLEERIKIFNDNIDMISKLTPEEIKIIHNNKPIIHFRTKQQYDRYFYTSIPNLKAIYKNDWSDIDLPFIDTLIISILKIIPSYITCQNEMVDPRKLNLRDSILHIPPEYQHIKRSVMKAKHLEESKKINIFE